MQTTTLTSSEGKNKKIFFIFNHFFSFSECTLRRVRTTSQWGTMYWVTLSREELLLHLTGTCPPSWRPKPSPGWQSSWTTSPPEMVLAKYFCLLYSKYFSRNSSRRNTRVSNCAGIKTSHICFPTSSRAGKANWLPEKVKCFYIYMNDQCSKILCVLWWVPTNQQLISGFLSTKAGGWS